MDEEDGAPRACVVSLDNVQPLDRALLVERIGRLRQERLVEVCGALAAAVECD